MRTRQDFKKNFFQRVREKRERERERERGQRGERGCFVELCLRHSFVAVLPAELENVPDDFLHHLEGLQDLGLNQRGEVNYSHVHLHTHTHTHTRRREKGISQTYFAKS